MEILLSRLINEHHDENPTFHSNITIVVLIITIIQISLNNIYIPFYFLYKVVLKHHVLLWLGPEYKYR